MGEGQQQQNEEFLEEANSFDDFGQVLLSTSMFSIRIGTRVPYNTYWKK